MEIDFDNIVKLREIHEQEEDKYSFHESLIANCDDYNEYVLKCYIDGIQPIADKKDFERIRSSRPYDGLIIDNFTWLTM